MEAEQILIIATLLASLICGFITKACPKISNKIIPLQNIMIGLIVAGIQFYMTKDFSTAVALSGLAAGGTYDLFKNIRMLGVEENGN